LNQTFFSLKKDRGKKSKLQEISNLAANMVGMQGSNIKTIQASLFSAWDIDTVDNRSGRHLEYVLYSSSRTTVYNTG
jgi:hypothetical protein